MDDPKYQTWEHDRLVAEATQLRGALEESISALDDIHSKADKLRKELDSLGSILYAMRGELEKHYAGHCRDVSDVLHLRNVVSTLFAIREDRNERIDQLIETLRPFARFGAWLTAMTEIDLAAGTGYPYSDDYPVFQSASRGRHDSLTWGDFRRAVEALREDLRPDPVSHSKPVNDAG
jgi:hypothetical protein